MTINLSEAQKRVLTTIAVLLLGLVAGLFGYDLKPSAPAAAPVAVKDIGESRFLSIMDDGRLAFTTAATKIIPGTTSLSIRDAGDSNDNLLVSNAGAATVRNGMTVTAGGLTVTAGGLSLSAGTLTGVGITTTTGITLSSGNLVLVNGVRALPTLLTGQGVVSNTTALYGMVNTVARTDTANKTMGVIPANANLTDLTVYYGTASDAVSTATLSCGKTSATPTEYVNAANMKATAGLFRAGSGSTFPVTSFGSVGAADVIVYCKYAETGGASTTGGPFTVVIQYAN